MEKNDFKQPDGALGEKAPERKKRERREEVQRLFEKIDQRTIEGEARRKKFIINQARQK